MPPTLTDEPAYGFTERDIQIIEEVCRRVIDTDSRKPAERGRWHKFVQGVLYGSLDGDLAAGSSATLSVYNPETDADTGENRTVYDRLLGTGKELVSGTKVFCTRMGNRWYVSASKACPTTA